jgi:hypothetical protein
MEQIRYEMRPGEFADAMKSTRAARMLFWLVLAVAIGSQVGSFLLVQFGGVLDRYRAGTVAAERPATAPSEGGAEAASPAPGAPKKPAEAPAKSGPAAARAAAAPPEPASPARALARKWHLGLRWLLPIARFTAAVAGELLQHVVEEADAGGNVIGAGAVEIDFGGDVGFPGLALDFRFAAHGRSLAQFLALVLPSVYQLEGRAASLSTAVQSWAPP